MWMLGVNASKIKDVVKCALMKQGILPIDVQIVEESAKGSSSRRFDI